MGAVKEGQSVVIVDDLLATGGEYIFHYGHASSVMRFAKPQSSF